MHQTRPTNGAQHRQPSVSHTYTRRSQSPSRCQIRCRVDDGSCSSSTSTMEYSIAEISYYLNKNSAVAEIGGRGHNRHGPKKGGCYAPFAGDLGPRLTQCGLGRGLLMYQVASSSIQPIDMNRKLGAVPLLGGSCDPI